MRSAPRSAVLWTARVGLLAGPTVLAFFTGGYFPTAQATAGVVAWALVGVAVLVGRRALPIRNAGWLAIGGLALLGGWTLLSIRWAPIAGSAYHAGQLVMLYVGVLLAAALLLRERAAQRSLEPALAAGVLIVVGYGIAERLLPGVLHYARSISAQGRLEQPLTYWNAMGELAALGLVLNVRLAGDPGRRPAIRTAALIASAPVGLGLYLSFSRGALFACAAGLVALMVAAPRREQLDAILLAVGAAVLASASAAPFGGVTSLAGSLATREREGAICLVALIVIATAAGAAHWQLTRRRRAGPLRLPRHSAWIATAIISAGLALVIAVGARETSGVPLSGGAARLVTLQSNRYAYWRVAFRAFAAEPLHGVGAGGWAVWWLRYRKIDDFAQATHSLPLQTLAELGVVGVLLLGAFFTGVGLAARSAHQAVPGLAAGPIAAFVTYVAHAPLDWDWQLPAVTWVALVAAGALLAQSDSAIRGASRVKTTTARAHTAT